MRLKKYLEIFLKFLNFGFLAWGGPVAQIALIHDEIVKKEKWISNEKFKKALAVYQALPGPEAHEMCVYLGMVKAGRLGGFLAGLGFMLPGFLLIILLAWAYVNLPAVIGGTIFLAIFAGVKPAVSALIVRALHRIGSHVVISKSLFVVALIAAIATAINLHFAFVLLACGVFHALWVKGKKIAAATVVLFILAAGIIFTPEHPSKQQPAEQKSQGYFAEGLKAGMLSFGGAYTVIPFLKDSMVDKYNGISEHVFLDGIALSGIIPAPLVIFATFLGSVSGGMMAAILITAGIFLPAFSFTLIGHKYLEKAIENKSLHGFLDGVAAGVVGILFITAIQIMVSSVDTVTTGFIFTLSVIILFRQKSKWTIPAVVIISGIIGYLASIFFAQL